MLLSRPFHLELFSENTGGNPKLLLCLPNISQRASLWLQTQRHTCRFPDPCLARFTCSGMSFRVVLSAFPTKPVNIPVLAKQCVDIAWRTRFCLNSKTSKVPLSFPPPVCNSDGLLVLGYYSWLRGKVYDSFVPALGSSSCCSNTAAQVWPASTAQERMGIGENQKMLQVRSSMP